jgi:hypothetical protein
MLLVIHSAFVIVLEYKNCSWGLTTNGGCWVEAPWPARTVGALAIVRIRLIGAGWMRLLYAIVRSVCKRPILKIILIRNQSCKIFKSKISYSCHKSSLLKSGCGILLMMLKRTPGSDKWIVPATICLSWPLKQWAAWRNILIKLK